MTTGTDIPQYDESDFFSVFEPSFGFESSSDFNVSLTDATFQTQDFTLGSGDLSFTTLPIDLTPSTSLMTYDPGIFALTPDLSTTSSAFPAFSTSALPEFNLTTLNPGVAFEVPDLTSSTIGFTTLPSDISFLSTAPDLLATSTFEPLTIAATGSTPVIPLFGAAAANDIEYSFLEGGPTLTPFSASDLDPAALKILELTTPDRLSDPDNRPRPIYEPGAGAVARALARGEIVLADSRLTGDVVSDFNTLNVGTASLNTGTGATREVDAPVLVAQVDRSTQLRPMRPVESLTGGLVTGEGAVPQLNRNFPEVLTSVGEQGNVGVSTTEDRNGLNFNFNGNFRAFSSAQNRTGAPIYQTTAFRNPGTRDVTVTVDSYGSFTTGQAPYTDAPRTANEVIPTNFERVTRGIVLNGPGQAAAAADLTGAVMLPPNYRSILVPAGRTVALPSEEIPNRQERVFSGSLRSDGAVQAAIVYTRQPVDSAGAQAVIARGDLLPLSSEDRVPTPADSPGRVIFGRVAGVAETSIYAARPTNNQAEDRFLITADNADAVQEYAFNTKRSNDLGTGRNEEGRILAGNPGSARELNPLNYGTDIRIGGDIQNTTNQPRSVRIYFNSTVPTGDSRAARTTIETVTPAITAVGASPQLTRDYVTVSQTQQTRGQTPIAEFIVPPGATVPFLVRPGPYAANQTGPHSISIVTGTGDNARTRLNQR